MKIDHIAVWVTDLEKMKLFYTRYFQGKAGSKYVNEAKGFSSYFLTFEDGTRLELMHKTGLEPAESTEKRQDLFHVAFATGSKEKVEILTEQLRSDGYRIYRDPRITGDGYYESIIADPEGNVVEITL